MANVRISLKHDTLSPRLQLQIRALNNAHRTQLLGAVGTEFGNITKSAIGPSGKNRANPWPQLSAGYAKKIGRTEATLLMTGAERAAVKKDPALPHLSDKISVQQVNAKQVVVGADIGYAAVHQLGKGKQPKRPYFPVKSDNKPTPLANNRMLAIIKYWLKKFKAI